ncbi:hypothetical protein [Magnetospirillum molischianum]|uniref:hypothetical protein n=1 Tax=Magnetospirillum molischianum TaxID=1083 RepID=UPI0012DF07A6|nr:hypothetical protein [Magnetospirillum molischianum]
MDCYIAKGSVWTDETPIQQINIKGTEIVGLYFHTVAIGAARCDDVTSRHKFAPDIVREIGSDQKNSPKPHHFCTTG